MALKYTASMALDLDDPLYLAAKNEALAAAMASIRALFTKHRLDAIVYPTSPRPATLIRPDPAASKRLADEFRQPDRLPGSHRAGRHDEGRLARHHLVFRSGLRRGEAAGVRVVALADLDGLQPRAPLLDDEHRPVVAAPEQTADRHLDDVVVLPDDDANFDAIAVAERARGRGGSSKSMSTLTRCSSTPSAETFMKPDGSTRRTRPSSGWPPPHCSMSTGAPGGTRTASVDSRSATISSALRIADLEERLAGRDDRFALAQPLQDDAVDRRHDLDRRGRPAPGACRRARASLQLVLRARDGELGGPQRLFGRRDRGLAPLRGCRAAMAPGLRPAPAGGAASTARASAPRPRGRARPAPGRRRRARLRPAAASSPRVRGSSSGASAAVSARQHGLAARRPRSPGSSSMRCSRPATGADTTNRSRTRVSPSSSMVTCSGPRVDRGRVDLDRLRPQRHAEDAERRPRRRRSAACVLSRSHQARRYSRIFSTATRSRRSSRRLTISPEMSVGGDDAEERPRDRLRARRRAGTDRPRCRSMPTMAAARP